MRFRISVISIHGKPLTYRVSKYKITEGNFVSFVDELTGKTMSFHSSRCEIVEEGAP